MKSPIALLITAAILFINSATLCAAQQRNATPISKSHLNAPQVTYMPNKHIKVKTITEVLQSI
jgi:hypothetical protein